MSATMNALASPLESAAGRPGSAGDHREFVSMTVGGQLFGIPVLEVRAVLIPQRITRVPLAPAEVTGSLNLRGRIVTAIELRTRLGLPARPPAERPMCVVVDHRGELYSLLVDSVGEVVRVAAGDAEPSPPTLDPLWRDVSAGIHRLADRLLVVIDIARVLEFPSRVKAA